MTDLLELLQSTDTPLWITLLSPLIVITGVVYTIRRTDRREIESWRRDKILTFTSDLIEQSNNRLELLKSHREGLAKLKRNALPAIEDTKHIESMRIAYDKLKILCNKQMSIAAQDLITHHEFFLVKLTDGQDSNRRDYIITEFDRGAYWRLTRLNEQLEKNLGLKRPWYIRARRFVYQLMPERYRSKGRRMLAWYRKKTNTFYRTQSDLYEEYYNPR